MSTAPATTESFTLGEGPVWDAARRRVLWVDIPAGAVLEGVLDGPGLTVVRRLEFDGTVGAVTVAEDGTLLVAAQERLVVVHPDGTREEGPRIVGAGEGRRLNDGATDPAGRFLVGTMLMEGDSEKEWLGRIEADGSVTRFDDDLTLSNGLAWSPDGRAMYSADTMRRRIHVRDYDPSSGAVGERRVHVEFAEDHPDGLTSDVENHLWVAFWGAGEVRRIRPDGSVAERLTVPAPHVTSVAFAGDDLDVLVITTATVALTDAQRREFPESGKVFTARVPVPGVPVAPWAGR